MSTTTPVADAAVPSEVTSYVDEVAAHLASLPWLSETDRAELLDDLAQHLSEVAAEEASPLAERLGPPKAYAEELVAAAGLEPPAATAERLGPFRLGVAAAAGWDRLQRMVAEAGDLRPAWWVLRGYLAASLVGAVTGGGHDGGGHPGFPIPAVFGSRVVGVLAIAAAVRVSVRWGQQGRPANRWVRRAAASGLAVYGLVLIVSVGDGHTDVRWVDSGTPIVNPRCLVNGAGQVIENLYPYDAQGRLLDQVLLYDQTGRPLDNLCPRDYDDQGRPIDTEYGQDENGAPVVNVFPRRQTTLSSPPEVSPGGFEVPPTSGSPRSVGPPAVVVPRLATTTTTTATTTMPPTTAGAAPTPTSTPSPATSTGSG